MGVRRALDVAIYRAAVRPLYGVGYFVGSVGASVLLFALGRRLSRS